MLMDVIAPAVTVAVAVACMPETGAETVTVGET